MRTTSFIIIAAVLGLSACSQNLQKQHDQAQTDVNVCLADHLACRDAYAVWSSQITRIDLSDMATTPMVTPIGYLATIRNDPGSHGLKRIVFPGDRENWKDTSESYGRQFTEVPYT